MMTEERLKQKQMLSRREFVRHGAITAAGLAVLGHSGGTNAQTPKPLNYNENMEYRRLGKTGLMISAISLGGHWKRIGTLLPGVTEKFAWTEAILNSEEFRKNRDEIVGYCIDQGINYVDACNASEILAYSRALRGRREKMYLGYSWVEKEPREKEWRTAAKLLQGLDEGMKQAELDYIDVWRISVIMPSSEHTFNETYEVVEALDMAKKQGKVRFTGLSSHDRKWLKIVINEFPEQMEVVLFPYTAKSAELPQESLFETVRQRDVGVLGIKPFASNSLFKGDSSSNHPDAEEDDRRARLAIRYILRNTAITAPIPGIINRHQVDNLVAAIKERRELDLKETAELRKATDEAWAKLPVEYQGLKNWEYV